MEGRLRKGQYGKVGEYFRDLVRREQEKRQDVFAEVQALNYGPGGRSYMAKVLGCSRTLGLGVKDLAY